MENITILNTDVHIKLTKRGKVVIGTAITLLSLILLAVLFIAGNLFLDSLQPKPTTLVDYGIDCVEGAYLQLDGTCK